MRKLISALIGMQLILLISTCAAQENTGTVSGPGLTAGDCTSGPDTCIQGFVWREAGPGDHVCVPPAIRDQTLGDNSQAAARRDPNGGPYGPDTCLSGFVWREESQNDHICVYPSTRAQVASDKSNMNARRACLH